MRRVINGERLWPAKFSLWYFRPAGGVCPERWYYQPKVGKYKKHCFFEPTAETCEHIYHTY